MAFTRMGTTKQRVHGIQLLGKCFIPRFQSGLQPDLLFAPIGLLQYIHNLVPAAAFRLVQIPEDTVIPEYFCLLFRNCRAMPVPYDGIGNGIVIQAKHLMAELQGRFPSESGILQVFHLFPYPI